MTASPENTHRWIWAVLAAWIFFLGVMNFQWGTPLLSGRLQDSDDYLRMVRVFDLADGNHYPANIQTRMGVTGSVENNWSRLVDAPLLAMLVVFQSFAGRTAAALMTVTAAPAIALLILMFLTVWYPRAGLTVSKPPVAYIFLVLAILLMQMMLLAQFAPGRVDHDMWQILLIMGGFGFLLRSSLDPQHRLFPVFAGILFGTGLSIGADMVPWLAVGAAFIGFQWLMRGRDYERACLRFGLSVFLAALLEFIILRPPGYFFEKVCDGISITYLSFAAAVAVFFAAVYFAPAALKKTWQGRAALSAVLSAVIVVALYAFFPVCFHDPYQFTDPVVRTLWLGNISEAESFAKFSAKRPLYGLSLLISVVLAAIAAAIAARVERDKRTMWAGWCLVLITGLALVCWQIRILRIVQLFTIMPLAWPFCFITRLNPARRDIAPRAATLIGLVMVTAGILFFYGAVHRHGEASPVLVSQSSMAQCSVRAATPVLDRLPAPQLIAADIDVGPEILYRTKHTMLAGPYHHDEAGIRAVIDLFTATDEDAARRVAEKYHVQVVMLCKTERRIWRRMTSRESFFASQLIDGAIPSWLVPVPGSGAGNFLIFKVQ